MSALDLAAVMDAIADTAVTGGLVEDGRAYPYPTATLSPPALVVDYPEGATPFDYTMQRGYDRVSFPVYYVIGKKIQDRTARGDLSDAATNAKTALDGSLGGVVASARVTDWQVVPFAVEALDYVAVKLTLDVLA